MFLCEMAASLVRSSWVGGQVLKFLRPSFIALTECKRGQKVWMSAYLKELYSRRLRVGPEKLRHRSEWINWNYDAEIFAFGKRLGEELSDTSLRRAFTHRSYIEKEEKQRENLGIDTAAAPLGLLDNTDLVHKGEATASLYIKAYLRHIYPAMFEEGIIAVHDHLMAEDTLAFVAQNIGISDLILCTDFPPEASTLSRSFLAVVGALESEQGRARAEALVRDLVLTQLIGMDFGDIWSFTNPMGLLVAMLRVQGRGPPEPRLLWQAGKRTVMAVYHVGIYSDRQLIGQSAGETATIAEEMAANDALRRLMGIEENATVMPFRTAEHLKLDYDRINVQAQDILQQFEESEKSQKSSL